MKMKKNLKIKLIGEGSMKGGMYYFSFNEVFDRVRYVLFQAGRIFGYTAIYSLHLCNDVMDWKELGVRRIRNDRLVVDDLFVVRYCD